MTTPKVDEPDAAEAERTKFQDDFLHEALEETFPASDPIAPGGVEGGHAANRHREPAPPVL